MMYYVYLQRQRLLCFCMKKETKTVRNCPKIVKKVWFSMQAARLWVYSNLNCVQLIKDQEISINKSCSLQLTRKCDCTVFFSKFIIMGIKSNSKI